jgi:hypothetical protein
MVSASTLARSRPSGPTAAARQQTCLPELELTRSGKTRKNEMNTETRFCVVLNNLQRFLFFLLFKRKGKHAERRAQLPIVPSHDLSIVLNKLD